MIVVSEIKEQPTQICTSCSEDELRILQRAADLHYQGNIDRFMADAGLLYASLMFSAMDEAMTLVRNHATAQDEARRAR